VEITIIDFGVITDLSGLLKAITYTIRVIVRLILKLSSGNVFVMMYEIVSELYFYFIL
jgi:hypothetical protein